MYQCWPIVLTNIYVTRPPLHWRHNDHDSVWNHQPHGCLLNRLFRRKSKKTSKLRVTGLCVGNSPGPVNSPHKGPVTRKMFPFDDVIMNAPKSQFMIKLSILSLIASKKRFVLRYFQYHHLWNMTIGYPKIRTAIFIWYYKKINN